MAFPTQHCPCRDVDEVAHIHPTGWTGLQESHVDDGGVSIEAAHKSVTIADIACWGGMQHLAVILMTMRKLLGRGGVAVVLGGWMHF